MAEHNELGQWGEEEAAKFLSEKGYKILEKQYRYAKLEVDLIAQNENQIVFVEVKTRAMNSMVAAEDTINKKKRSFIIEAANHYMETKNIPLEVRFDIITIETDGHKKSIQHIEDAFNSIH